VVGLDGRFYRAAPPEPLPGSELAAAMAVGKSPLRPGSASPARFGARAAAAARPVWVKPSIVQAL